MRLNPQMTLQPFEKWAIDFVGPIKPQGKTDARYIITAMEYLTHLANTKLVKDCMDTTVPRFIFEHVLMQFGCTEIFMSDYRLQYTFSQRDDQCVHRGI